MINYQQKKTGQQKKLYTLFCMYLLLLAASSVNAQQATTISGRVTELNTNNGIPFANVYFKGGGIGAITDFDGNYTITNTTQKDSIYVALIGYESKAKYISKEATQVINFQLATEALNLSTIEVHAGVNPALRIIKKAIDNKSIYNRENLNSVQYLSYTKQEADIDNISERLRKRKFLKPIINLWDNLDTLVGGENKANLPVAMSEVIADIYALKDTKKKHEFVNAVKIKFVGMKDGSGVTQLTGTDFQSYNFCNNNVAIQGKDFLSPIADNALLFYNYYLIDSVTIDSLKCYLINCSPKNKKDLAYTGTLWIADSSFAIKQLDLEITKDVNFNLVDRVRIQQKLIPTEAQAWVPFQTSVMVDYTKLSKKMISMVLHTYNCNRYYIVNQPKENNFYETRIAFAEDAIIKDTLYWQNNRPEQLTPLEIQSIHMIDTIRKIPFVKRGVGLVYFFFSGYKDVGPIDLGHYMNLYAYNAYEGTKIRLGFRTNSKFSNNWIIRGYGAYGFRDKGFKYNLQLERILTRFPWSKAGVQYREDVSQVGTSFDYSTTINLGQPPNTLVSIFSDINTTSKLVYKKTARVWYEKDFDAGFNLKFTMHNTRTKPLFPVAFGDQFNIFQTRNYSITEILIDAKYSANERFIQNGTERISFGNQKSPIITLNYTLGIKQLFNSDFDYHKINISGSNRFRMAILGYSQVLLRIGKVFSKIPYTLLEIPRGNHTYFYGNNLFNKMNYLEFVSDQYVELFWQHHFNGLLFNRIPLVKQLNLREVIGANAVYGTLSKKNKNFNSNNNFTVMTTMPYVEASIGIENIFKIIRVDYIYRLTYNSALYKNNYEKMNFGESIINWGIKVGLQFNF